MEETKVCTKCGTDKPLTEYYKNRARKNGLTEQCKDCTKKRVREWAHSNPETAMRWHWENREYAIARNRKWKEDNAEYNKAYKKEYNAKHKAEIQAWRKDYYARNKDRIKEHKQNTREQSKVTRKKWEASNPELVRAKGHRYRTKKAGNGGSYTPMEWFDLCETYNWQCLCCGKHSYESPLTVDHIIPVTKGGSSNISDLQPLCDHCNKAKSTKTTDYRLEQNMHPTVLSHLQTTRNL